MYPDVMDKKLKKIFDYLQELFPNPETELHYSTPFQFVVAVMLSAQATDIQVNKVTSKLFEKIKMPADVISMGFETFKKSISSVNYYKSKAKHIFETARLLADKIPRPKGRLPLSSKGVLDGIPDSLEELMKLPGIGVKTAKLIAHVLYDKPFIAVDTHIHRVANRLGLVKTTSPEKTSELLEKLIPDTYKDDAHHGLVLFGRYHCMARKPKCKNCELKSICVYYQKNEEGGIRN